MKIRMRIFFVIISVFTCVMSIAQVSETPPMGWNSFSSYGVYLYEETAYKNLKTMAEKYKPFGYEYFVIDNGWFGEYKLRPNSIYPVEKHASDINMNEYGLIQPSKTYFPNGFGNLVKECHRKGLKFGLHLMRGIPRKAVRLNTPIKGTAYHARDIANLNDTCSWCQYNYGIDVSKPGAQEFYNSLINQLAEWGVDFIKMDDIVPYPQEIQLVANAIKQCGRKILLSLSPGDKVLTDKMKTYENATMLRVTHDIWDDRQGIFSTMDAWKKWQTYSGNLWIDMDLISFGQLQLMSPKSSEGEKAVALAGKGKTRKSELTPSEQRIFITLRSLSASPLFIGGDLPSMDDYSYRLLTNEDIIAANQNGVIGRLIDEDKNVQVWHTPCKNGKGGWIGIFNLSNFAITKDINIKSLLNEKKINEYIFDVWNNKEIEIKRQIVRMEIPPFDVLFLRYGTIN